MLILFVMHTPQKYEFAMPRINNDRYCSDLREQVFNFNGKKSLSQDPANCCGSQFSTYKTAQRIKLTCIIPKKSRGIVAAIKGFFVYSLPSLSLDG